MCGGGTDKHNLINSLNDSTHCSHNIFANKQSSKYLMFITKPGISTLNASRV